MAEYLLFKLADEIVRLIYKETFQFPYKYQSSIGDQLRRSSLSIVLNIVEGGARKSIKERRYFNNISYGSLKETRYLVSFCDEYRLIEQLKCQTMQSKINRLAAILYGLQRVKRET